MQNFDDQIVKDFLFGIFSSLNFWRNNTKNKIIPVAIMKQTHLFFATFMCSHGPAKLIQVCDSIQPGILFMIMKSEGDKIKLVQSPPRDRKYVIKAYTDLVVNYAQSFQGDSLGNVISCLI